MNVWLLGRDGMLGQAVGRRLQQLGAAQLPTGREVDITDADACLAFAAAHRPTHIINCAAYTKVDACESELHAAMAVNAAGPAHLAAAAHRLGAALLHVSTDYVFDGQATAPYDEAAACAPLGAYGHSKAAGEAGLWRTLGAAGPPAWVVRTSWLFGHGGNNFVRTMLRLLQTRPQLRVVGDQVGRPTFCDDLAAACLELMGLGAAAPAAAGTYHFANAGVTSWHGFACGIAAQARQLGATLPCQAIEAIKTADYPTPARRPAYSVLCTRKIGAVLRQPPRPWEQALQSYLQVELAAASA